MEPECFVLTYMYATSHHHHLYQKNVSTTLLISSLKEKNYFLHSWKLLPLNFRKSVWSPWVLSMAAVGDVKDWQKSTGKKYSKMMHLSAQRMKSSAASVIKATDTTHSQLWKNCDTVYLWHCNIVLLWHN